MNSLKNNIEEAKEEEDAPDWKHSHSSLKELSSYSSLVGIGEGTYG